jgi:hypothetical protein
VICSVGNDACRYGVNINKRALERRARKEIPSALECGGLTPLWSFLFFAARAQKAKERKRKERKERKRCRATALQRMADSSCSFGGRFYNDVEA